MNEDNPSPEENPMDTGFIVVIVVAVLVLVELLVALSRLRAAREKK